MNYIANYSGGKDSTAMIILLIEHRRPIDYVIFFDFGMEYPETYREVELMKKLCDAHGIKFITAKPEHTFEWYAADKPRKHRGGDFLADGAPKRTVGNAFPNSLRRWCTKVKCSTIKRTLRSLGCVPRDTVHYIGIAADEPKRLVAKKNCIYPLAEYGVTEAQALAISKEHGFFQSPHPYDDLKRVSCYCCPLSCQKTIFHLIENYPALWENVKRIESKIKANSHRSTREWEFHCIDGKSTAYFERKYEKLKSQGTLF